MFNLNIFAILWKNFKKYNEWVNFQHLQVRGVKCKIKIESFKNIPF